MTRAERLTHQADEWSAIFKKTRRYDALEKAKELRTASLIAGLSRKAKRRLKRMKH